MKLASGRTFRFSYTGIDPSNADNEFGAIIKTSFEIFTGNMHSDHTGYYDDTAAYPGRVCTYYVPTKDRFVNTTVPLLRFEYFAVMRWPQASTPAPIKVIDANIKVRWRWTAGYMPYPYMSDVVVVDTGNLNLNDYRPEGAGVPGGAWNGILYHWDPFAHSAVYVPPVNRTDFHQLAEGTGATTPGSGSHSWDDGVVGKSHNLNLFVNVVTTGPEIEGYVSAGYWRFVHLFHEML
jgi:hypothetical protein